MMVLLIDNYDSFSYNLYQYIGEINPDIKVMRNDELTAEEIRALHPDRIILSRDPADLRTRASSSRWCESSARRYRSSACVSDIRRSARRSAQP